MFDVLIAIAYEGLMAYWWILAGLAVMALMGTTLVGQHTEINTSGKAAAEWRRQRASDKERLSFTAPSEPIRTASGLEMVLLPGAPEGLGQMLAEHFADWHPDDEEVTDEDYYQFASDVASHQMDVEMRDEMKAHADRQATMAAEWEEQQKAMRRIEEQGTRTWPS